MMGFRKWLAWRLVGIAHRLHDPEWLEHISVESPTGATSRINFIGDEYGCGICTTSGFHWRAGTGGMTAEVEGWKFFWSDAVRYGYADE